MKKLYKVVEPQNGASGKLEVYGSNRSIKIEYVKPYWRSTQSASFRFNGHRYFLDEFEKVHVYSPEWMQEFDGIHSESFFSGVLVKLTDEGESIRAFAYYG